MSRRTVEQILRASAALRAAGFTEQEILHALVVPTAQYRIVSRKTGPDLRRERMVLLYKEGKTLEEIGVEFGVTRERVRQIIRLGRSHGGKCVITEQRTQDRLKAKKDRRDARCKTVFGCDYETALRLNEGRHPTPNNNSKASAYLNQKRTMQGVYQNVPYSLTFPEWLEAWGDKYCFKGKGKWGLVRIDDTKGFVAGNVIPKSVSERAAETIRRTHSRMAQIRSLLDSGVSRDQIAKQLGIKRGYLDRLKMYERRFASA